MYTVLFNWSLLPFYVLDAVAATPSVELKEI